MKRLEWKGWVWDERRTGEVKREQSGQLTSFLDKGFVPGQKDSVELLSLLGDRVHRPVELSAIIPHQLEISCKVMNSVITFCFQFVLKTRYQ